MALSDLSLKNVYRSGKDDLLKDFYIPVLLEAKYYDRAVGYFSTSLIAYALKGISSIVKNDGRMRLVVGCPLDQDEFDALKEGNELRSVSKILHSELDKIIESSVSKIEKTRLHLFMMLIATNRLEMKFAFKPKGMYHEKIGIIRDENDNKILFHGSANETINAIRPDLNYESIAVYRNWNPEIYSSYAQEFENGFEELWGGKDKNIMTIDMPSDVYEKISQAYVKSVTQVIEAGYDEIADISELFEEREYNYPVIPKTLNGNPFKVFEHQTEALKNWFSNGRAGLFRLATGSGKTITSMYGVSTIFEKSKRPRKMLFVVAVPYQALAEQWVKELALFNMKPIKCFGSKVGWEDKLSNSINLLQSGNVEFVSVVVVNRTLVSSRFKSLILRMSEENIVFVGDECHRHATEKIMASLPKASFKMGLSATPYLEDEELQYEGPNAEKEMLTGYYGNVVADYSLTQALSSGILTP
ncbi:MAG: DEAD/DEAH box helicase family protein [gamma proteobacterium endosymbiont of Lamellibrachia anaximandri]|nr:DEAD/DEAH box helicase family protein [gamma proteobacterium endosymbiont of Lamellibrachia anaximandri]MBL3535745.1 DEAD/DEAH box helicase family protein [gamma proteobacterium endosymbiont of Lamellibrachia anaximandri]